MANEAEKEKHEDPEGSLNRRQFFVRIGLGSLAVAGAGTAVFAYQFLSPNVLYEPSPIVNAGKPASYPPDSVTLDPATGIFVVRETQGFYALSAVCTHLGCLTAWKPELGIIACPCHGSKFKPDGTKIAGPAPKPLPCLRMWLSDDGDLMVDRSSPMTARQFVRI
jgi:cytochrome b6-f complex iron-sulfur subunit